MVVGTHVEWGAFSVGFVPIYNISRIRGHVVPLNEQTYMYVDVVTPSMSSVDTLLFIGVLEGSFSIYVSSAHCVCGCGGGGIVSVPVCLRGEKGHF